MKLCICVDSNTCIKELKKHTMFVFELKSTLRFQFKLVYESII